MICISTRRYQRRPIQDGDTYWLPLSIVAKEYNRHPCIMRRWCINGFFIELGYRVRRGEKGSWYVGATDEQLRNFRAFRALSD